MAEVVVCNENSIRELQSKIKAYVELLNQYRWLIDAYISDFFVLDYWKKIQPCWREELETMSPPQHCFLLDTHGVKKNADQIRRVLPLSLLSFCKCLKVLALKRQCVDLEDISVQHIIKSSIGCESTLNVEQPECTGETSECSGETSECTGETSECSGETSECTGETSECAGETSECAGETSKCTGETSECTGETSECTDKTSECTGETLDRTSRPVNESTKQSTSSSAVYEVGDGLKASSTLTNGQDYALYHVFRRHVKPKKQHEIHRLSKGVELLSDLCDCKKLVDVGAGLGHLSRILTFKKGLSVTTVEAAGTHAPKAFKYDKEMERDINKVINRIEREKIDQGDDQNKNVPSNEIKSLPNHVVCTISSDISAKDFVKILDEKHTSTEYQLNDSGSEFGDLNSTSCESNNNFMLGGLHACGDLTATLLRVFVSCEKTVGVASVGCCYMKLTCRSDGKKDSNSYKEEGYPMSEFVKHLPNHQLSYAAREMACHFADSYSERLKDNKEHLKVHCYRAAFEHILTLLHPEFDQGSMKLTVKNTTDMPFESYCKLSLRKLGYTDDIPADILQHAEGFLSQWKNVMSFYTIRLSLAPVVESLILLDRLMFLYEQGTSSMLVPIFDPSLSPRNFLLLANKGNKIHEQPCH